MVAKSKFIDFRVDPKGTFKKALLEAGKKSDDLRVPFQQITASFYKSNKFLFEPGKYRSVFDDLKPVTKRIKQKNLGWIYPILAYTGDLARSITDPNDPNTIATVVNKKELLLGTKLPYASHLQFGTKRMVARPFLVVGTEKGKWAQSTQMQRRKKAWMEVLEKYCADSLRLKKGK
jgi:phage gpG-like protein